MKLTINIIKTFFFLLFLTACSSSVDPGKLAGNTAKVYYDALLKGDYGQYVDGFYRPDSISADYREQLITNAKMFIKQQHNERKGIRDTHVVSVAADSSMHFANVFLQITYGDKSTEEIVVPMVEHNGVWYMR